MTKAVKKKPARAKRKLPAALKKWQFKKGQKAPKKGSHRRAAATRRKAA